MTRSLSYCLNASRWIAALLVLSGHTRNLLLVDYPQVQSKSAVLKGLYFFTGLGHEAVVVFFVISGFLVGGLTLEKWQSKGVDIKSFAIARIGRVYTVLLPALVCGLALDYIGLSSFNSGMLYTNASQLQIGSISNLTSTFDLKTFVGNALMLQTIAVETAGSNGPLWSLANEWWYYCIFACLGFTMFARVHPRWGRLPHAAAAFMSLAFVTTLPLKITLWAFVWCLGVAIPFWIKSKKLLPHPAFGLGVFAIALTISRQSHGVVLIGNDYPMLDQFLKDLALGASYSIALVSVSAIGRHLTWSWLHQRMADFSFTTYLFHFPLMLFLTALAFQVFGLSFRRQPDVAGLIYFTIMVAVVLFACYYVSFFTEKKTGEVRNILIRVASRFTAGTLYS